MAISTPTTVIASGNVNNLTVYDTAAVTLTAGRKYYLEVTGYRTTANNISSVVHDPTGTSLSFNLVTGARVTSWDTAAHRTLEVWEVVPGSTTANALIRITWAAGQSACGWRLIEVSSGFDTSGTEVQVVTNKGTTTAVSLTMAAFGATDNMLLLFVGWGTGTSNPTATIAPTESRTELGEHNDGERASQALHYQNPNGSDTSVGATISATNDWGAIGIEVKAAAAGSTFTQDVSGSTTPAGALVKQTNKPLAGSTSPTGALVRFTMKPLAGSTSPTGALIKQAQKLLAGGTSPTGSLLKQAQKILAGTLSSSGVVALTKVVLKTLTATLTSAGALVRQTNKALAGTVTSSGALVRQTQKRLTAAIASSGALFKQVAKTLTGTTAPTGALSIVKAILRTFTASLTSSGTLVKQTQKRVTGTVTPTGALTRLVGKVLTGTVVPAGAIVKRIAKLLAGVLSSIGTLTKQSSGGGGPAVVIGDTSVDVVQYRASVDVLNPAASVVAAAYRATVDSLSPAASVAVTPYTATVE